MKPLIIFVNYLPFFSPLTYLLALRAFSETEK